MFSQLTRRLPRYSLVKIDYPSYSTNIYKRNYYLPTLPASITSITRTITETQNSDNFPTNPRILKYTPPLLYGIKRSITSLDTPKEIEQAERWLKKFTKKKIPKGKRD